MQELIKNFDFNGSSIRVITNGENQVFFVAKEVCDVLGYTKSTSAIIDSHCKSEGCTKMVLPSDGGNQEQIVINEGNLYRLVLKSKKKEAEKFESWVCDEVLPSIRKSGKYDAPTAKPLSTLDYLEYSLKQMREQDARISTVETKLLEIEAKTTTRPEYFTVMGYAILSNVKVGLALAAQIGKRAKIICQNKGYQIEKIRDPRFGQVGCYPSEVLQEVFSTITIA